MRSIMHYSCIRDTSDMQIRIFLGNFLRYRGEPIKIIIFRIRYFFLRSKKNISVRIPPQRRY